jgi:hypothetical protein
MAKRFWVVDLDATGEVKLKEPYEYDTLQSLDLAAMLIAEFATYLWRDPEGFDVTLPGLTSLTMRWCPSAPTAGIAMLRHGDALASISLLVTGLDPRGDAFTLQTLQDRLVRQLHDTGYEPAFDLVAALPERPLVASVHLRAPPAPDERAAFALADRAFAAAYFRRQGLA